jgi:hypothetical protein
MAIWTMIWPVLSAVELPAVALPAVALPER